jgi:hypothetical protein
VFVPSAIRHPVSGQSTTLFMAPTYRILGGRPPSLPFSRTAASFFILFDLPQMRPASLVSIGE